MQGVILNGGLGNQLFQLAAACSASEDINTVVILNLGNPTSNIRDEVDLQEFKLPTNIKFRQLQFRFSKFVPLLKIAVNLMLRLSSEKKDKIFNVLSPFFRVLLHITVRDTPNFTFCRGVGFDELEISHKNFLLCGYFQSYKYIDERTFRMLMNLRPKQETGLLVELIQRASEEKPIMVHMRLGDYLGNDAYGIPNLEYYETGIRKLKSLFPDSPIWLFTNDIEEAKRIVSEAAYFQVDFYPDVPNSPCENLELMRYGQGFLIGNSSFSWWGSYLRYDQSAPVIYPEPWYKNMPTPIDLTPAKWMPMKSGFRNLGF